MPRESLALRRETSGGELRPAVGSANEYNSALRSESTYLPSELALPQSGITIEDVASDTIRISFNQTAVAADSTFGSWTEAVLIKSTAGIPLNSLGGTRILHVVNNAAGLAQFEGGWVNTLDTALEGGRWYYYALFARYFNGGNVYWLKVGEASWLNPFPFGYGERFWRMIPEYYRSEDSSRRVHGGMLKRVVDSLGYEFDVARTWASTLGDLWDFEKISAKLLPEAAHALGQPLEAAAGDKRMRTLLINLMSLRKMKGTVDGIEGYLAALTGYRVKVFSGLNLLLRHDDAEATLTSGAWSSVVDGGTPSGTVTRSTSTTSPTNGPPANTPYIRNTNSTGAGTTLAMALPVHTDLLGSIPVIPAHQYRFSTNVSYSGTAVAFEVQFNWRDINGTSISSVSGSLGSFGGGTWQRLNTAFLTAPANAAFVRLVVKTVTAGIAPNGSILQIWRPLLGDIDWYPEGVPGAAATDALSNTGAPLTSYENPNYYEAPRMLYVSVFPRRANMARNSTFKLNGNSPGSPVANAWTVEDAATFALIPVGYATFDSMYNTDPGESPTSEDSFLDLQTDIDPLTSTATITYDTVAGTMTLAAPGPAPFSAAVKSHWFPVMESEDMSAAVTTVTSVAGTQMRLKLRWYSNKTVGGQIVNADGTIAENASAVYLPPVGGAGTTTERFIITGARPPAGAAFGRLVIETTNTVSFSTTFSDILIEPSAVPGTYFDGNETDGDFGDFFFANEQPQWETESAYYPSFRSFLSNPGGSARATAILGELVPAGTIVKLLTAANGLFPMPG